MHKTRTEVKDELKTYIDGHPGTSFAEVEMVFERCGYDYDGDMSMIGKNDNIVLWSGFSEDAVNLVNEVLAEGYRMELIDPLAYLIDGRIPSMPVVKQGQREYKTPHWLPVALTKADSDA